LRIVGARVSTSITGSSSALAFFGDGELRIDPCCVSAGEVVDGHARRG
jgi:hypothetical protein